MSEEEVYNDQVGNHRLGTERQFAQQRGAAAPRLATVSLVLGIVSIVLGLVAVGLFASLMPLMIMVGLPLAPVGLILGIAGVIVASTRRRGYTYPVVGSILGLLSTIIAAVLLFALLDLLAR
jgi:vacuolar-type H+-ATPase subunit I/STV1